MAFDLLPYIDRKRRKEIEKETLEKSIIGFDFYALTGLSAIIVTLGLIIDSSSVVIGAMIIAPFFWPLIGFSLALATGRFRLANKLGIVLAQATILAIALAFLVSFLSPLKFQVGYEILTRTDPNIVHLFIAIFSGIAGAFCVIWPGIISSIAGVLIAVALVPPLGVLGHSLVGGDLISAWGAFLLFATNLLAVVFVASITFVVFGFRPTNLEKEERRARFEKNIFIFFVLMSLIAVPLTFSLIDTVQQYKFEQLAVAKITESFPSVNREEITNLELKRQSQQIKVRAILQSTDFISSEEINLLKSRLRTAFDQQVTLDITVIDVRKYK